MNSLNVNGQSYQVDVPSNTPLLGVLRDRNDPIHHPADQGFTTNI